MAQEEWIETNNGFGTSGASEAQSIWQVEEERGGGGESAQDFTSSNFYIPI